ncbi:MAG: HDOD domain-containing protein [Thermodesulfobacteriota bacterium]|nr:HDOD domain-containing protein [Thermodesulfobacteriota bacterium]
MNRQEDNKLVEIFTRVNLSDLPAMSEHIDEIRTLAADSQSTMSDMVRIVMKDYGLAIKILREANSAYYTSKRAVSTISVAAGKLGFNLVLERALELPVIEDFVQAGLEEGDILAFSTKAFLSATLARTIAVKQKIYVSPEDAFGCALLHHLGKGIVLLYLPDIHREVVEYQTTGSSEEESARNILKGLTYSEIGMEIARAWNFSETVVNSMDPDPPDPIGVNDTERYLYNLACFSNRLVDAVCGLTHTNILLDRFGELFGLDKEEALRLLDKSAKSVRKLSAIHKRGLAHFKIRGRIRALEKTVVTGSVRPKMAKAFQEGGRDRETTTGAGVEAGGTAGAGENERQSRPKSIGDFIQAINTALKGQFDLEQFVGLLLGGLHKGIGFDRVILTALVIQPDSMALVGRFGIGDISGDEVRRFEHSLSDPGHVITRCLIGRQDTAVKRVGPRDTPSGIKNLVKDRFLYLLPVSVDNEPVGLLYLDRRSGRQPLSKAQLKAAKVFRDLMAKGVSMKMDEFCL